MNIASQGLCEQLVELSAWRDLPDGNAFVWSRNGAGRWFVERAFHGVLQGQIPAYSLDYLMRKLPPFIKDRRLTLQPTAVGEWCASYDLLEADNSILDQFAKSPEDAVAMLAAELFNRGLLKKDEQ